MVQRPDGGGDADGAPRGGALRWFGTVSPAAVIGLLLAALSLALPALWALGVSGIALALGVQGRRRFREDPSTGPGWISMAAIILGGFVFVTQGALILFATVGN
ncbi:hypothetical protein [Agromyces indicus]|uniref:DUF4190 domain-containing protein n=1 Tax=Agromyces indicus TaxID=758919 RepID=A0ABU1FJF3_9MICO|nr:hypothetical protein [Agromyces indicus]MDR5691892.1 hypothetical protein [Agromyces indicus]